MTNRDCLEIHGEWIFYFSDGRVIRRSNLIVNTGLALIAALIMGEESNVDMPAHLAMGTGTTPAAAADTKLEAEGFRKPVSAITRQGNLIRYRAFFLSNEANEHWKEFGIFLKGTDVPNSGVLLNRVVAPISKTVQQALTIEVRIYIKAKGAS